MVKEYHTAYPFYEDDDHLLQEIGEAKNRLYYDGLLKKMNE